MAKLYELAEQYRDLSEKLEGMDGQTIIDTLEGSAELMSIETKVVGIVQMLKNWESEVPGYDAEIKRLTESRDAINNRVKTLKNYLKQCLELAQLEKIKIGVHSVRLQNNSRGAVIVEDLKLVPAKYMDIVPEHTEVNNERVLADIKANVEIPGVKYQIGKHVRLG